MDTHYHPFCTGVAPFRMPVENASTIVSIIRPQMIILDGCTTRA